MHKFLAIDTTAIACSVALSIAGNVIEQYVESPQKHAELILPMIEQVIADAGLTLAALDGIVFAKGPGSFTGIRIATSVAQGLAYAVDIPLLGVSSLACLAQQAYEDQGQSRVLAALDARMGQIYWGVYNCNNKKIMCNQRDDQLTDPTALPLRDMAYACGNAFLIYKNLFDKHTNCIVSNNILHPRAKYLLKIADIAYQQQAFTAASMAIPHYIRDNIVQHRPK